MEESASGIPIIDYIQSSFKAQDVYLFIASLLALAVLFMLFNQISYTSKISSRVKLLQGKRAQLKAEMLSAAGGKKAAKKPSIGAATSVNLIRLVVDKLNLLQKSQVGRVNKMLANAGYRSKDAIFIFTFFQLVSPVIAICVAFLYLDIDFSDLFSQKLKILMFIGTIYTGVKLPQILVDNARNKRYYAIQKGLSDTLDLMMICAEAGLSLAASLDRVSRELGMTYPELAEELSLTSIELNFLPDRKKALLNLAERVDISEIRGIVTVLLQTEKYGTPVSQALRVLASEFRTQRMLRAEQKAARLPAIMTVPMIIFILPTLFVVVLAPALLKVFTMF